MAGLNKKLKSTITDIAGKNWAELCESSQSSQSQTDKYSPSKNVCGKDDNDDDLYDIVFKSTENDNVSAKEEEDDDDLYDAVFKSIKKETIKAVPQDDLSLTSFMNNVHMVTPIKQEENVAPAPNVDVDEDTICSPFVKNEWKPVVPQTECSKDKVPDKGIQHAKRRLTSECESTTSDSATPEQANKFHKKSTEHKNIHDDIESPKIKLELETDSGILARRQKQIDFGKNTVGYEKYLEQVPKHNRKKEHPKTPPKNLKYTRRAWDGLVKNWRLRLHCWDPDSRNNDDDVLTTSSGSNLFSHGSVTSLDSSSLASDSRPSTPPPTNRLPEDTLQVKHEAIELPVPVKFKTENN